MTRPPLDALIDDIARAIVAALAPHLLDLFSPPIRIVPVLGPFREQSPGGSVPTPNRVSRIRGRVLVAFQLGSSQEVTVTVEFRDRRGNQAPVDDVPEWLVDNSELLSLEPAPDGLSCILRAVGPLGTANVTLSADADLGDGSTPIIGTLEVEVTAGAATVVALVPGEAKEQAIEDLPDSDEGIA